jgi:hypothetical protein
LFFHHIGLPQAPSAFGCAATGGAKQVYGQLVKKYEPKTIWKIYMARYVGRRSWTGLEPELFGPQCSCLGFAVAVTQKSAMIELEVSGLLNLEQPWQMN